uniref:Uncharacterized protein n=1 Tax=Arundo donax TaxID=35708 RepID=A0A0A9DBG5_ARUDO
MNLGRNTSTVVYASIPQKPSLQSQSVSSDTPCFSLEKGNCCYFGETWLCSLYIVMLTFFFLFELYSSPTWKKKHA